MGSCRMTYTRDLALPPARKRKIVGTFLVVFVLSLANEIFDWRLVGDYDWEAIMALLLVGLIVIPYSIRSAHRH